MLETQGKKWGVRELASALHLPASTTHRVLSSLEKEGLVEQDPESCLYQVGIEFYRLAWRSEAQFPIRDVAVPFMREIVARYNETVFLGVYDPFRRQMLYAAAAESTHAVRYILALNEWIPVYAGAGGLAIMAFLPEIEWSAIIKESHLSPLTEHTITDPNRLRQELQKTRSRGYSITYAQRIPGTFAIGAPIKGHNGRIMGSLVLSIPEQRFNQADVPEMASVIMDYASRINAHLT